MKTNNRKKNNPGKEKSENDDFDKGKSEKGTISKRKHLENKKLKRDNSGKLQFLEGESEKGQFRKGKMWKIIILKRKNVKRTSLKRQIGNMTILNRAIMKRNNQKNEHF